MTQTFFDYMAIPEKCLLDKTLFKKLFQEHADLDVTDKKALKDDIDKIRWVYTLKPTTINIAPFKNEERDYDEVAVIQVDLLSAKRAQRIAAFVNKAIPYPIVLVFTFNDTIAVCVADKRINQADKTKWVIEDTWMTEWFNPDSPNKMQQEFLHALEIKNLSFVNFYAFFTDIKNSLISLNTANRSGAFSKVTNEQANDKSTALKAIEKLEFEKTELQNKMSKETQMGKQVALATKIKNITDQINDLTQGL